MQIFKTMDASEVRSREEFSLYMEASYSGMFSSVHSTFGLKTGNEQKKQEKTTSTSITVEGGDQEIASIITDFYSPTIKYDLRKWLASIPTYPKPFKFIVGSIVDLLKFSPSALFPDEKRDWGCEAHTSDMKEDPITREKYYEVTINGTVVRKNCPYKSRDDMFQLIERRRNSLERAVAVYMEEV